jgi:FtsZ-binding cell division protein ZapB
VLVTHSATLEELESPVQIPFELDAACTAVQVQGEFLFTFEPYPGTWAKEHFRRVVLHKFDASACRYRKVTTYELDRHYCNCAVASGRYLVISFWPYEDETMRTVWECMRIGRTMEKALATNSSEIKSLRGEVEELKRQLRGKEQELQQAQGEASALRQQTQQLKRSVQQAQRVIASKSAALSQGGFYVYNLHDDQKRDLRGGPVDQLSRARSKTAQARSDARTQRLKVEALRRQSNRMQKSYESQRMERRRLADPIHIYALNSGRDGFNREDWTLVLDYHKGAHELSLSAPPGGGSTAQMLEVLEHSTVVQFELCVPRDVASIGVPLPLQPGRLCDQF